MKKIKLLLLALLLLLTGCDNKPTNTTSVGYKQEFYIYLENNFNIPDGGMIITVKFHDTEAHTFDCDYIVADVYYNTWGDIYIVSYILAVKEGSICQLAEVK